MPPCPTSNATQSILSGFKPSVVELLRHLSSEQFFYQQKACTCVVTIYTQFTVVSNIYYTTPAPPTPTEVTAQFINASVRVAWQWTRSGPAPSCFNTTCFTYHPEGGGESYLQLSDPAATEVTLTDLQCNTNYTITVVATAGEHRREGVMFLPLQGMVY